MNFGGRFVGCGCVGGGGGFVVVAVVVGGGCEVEVCRILSTRSSTFM